ncbi:hypothetical protein ACIA5D_03625 [Actinoplanes sp. NPDC051513]|uniref:hypothetical protein n=1 Tax=Actinoplanes sp. NPDC051513 TaxID=3363908 RepID=UPI0037A2B890
MPAPEHGQQAIASSPSHEMARAVVPAHNRRQDLTHAYGLKPPPPVAVYDQVEAIARVFGQAPASEPRPEPTRVSSVLSTPPHEDSTPPPADHAPRPAPAPRQTYRPRPPASPPAPLVEPPEPAPVAPERRSGRWIAVAAVASLAGAVGAGVWAVDTRAKSQTCDTVQTLISASAGNGGPASADLDQAASALNNRIGRLMFHAGLKDAAHGLAADIASLGRLQASAGDSSVDVTRMLAVVASINDHGRAAQRECGMPEKVLFEVTSG